MRDYDPRIVALYDEDNPDGPDHAFYRGLADRLGARAVLDVGCGTGILTVTLARCGRRVIGLDPSAAMLAHARGRSGASRIEWVLGDSSAAPRARFDLTLMTGNVAQHIDDAAWVRTLHDLRERMPEGGVIALESRNPAARAWEAWHQPGPVARTTSSGILIEWMTTRTADERTVDVTAYTIFPGGEDPVVSDERLIFRSASEIESDLIAAGFLVDAVHGDWTGRPRTASDAAMIFVARSAVGRPLAVRPSRPGRGSGRRGSSPVTAR